MPKQLSFNEEIAVIPSMQAFSVPHEVKLSTRQIGKLGELLIQYELLRYGIESAPMTTDSGVDLVAYSATGGRAITIQVKTNLKPKPGGGKGALAIDWWVSDDCPAQWFALADLDSRRIWLFKKKEFFKKAQQKSKNRGHLYMYIEPGTRAYAQNGDHKFDKYLFERKIENFIHK